ncbi:MAG TPA: hypothetical protein VGL94_08685 [Ktedonobacteraceae bacterium]|jgi:hypothetical protein
MNDQSNEQVRDELRQLRPFNPNEHIIQIKSDQAVRDYLPVQWRLVWFRSLCPEGTIATEIIHLDLDRDTEEEIFVWNNEKRRSEKVVKYAKGLVIFKATVSDGKGAIATGTKMEKAASFSDWLEKAETGAIGRALAGLGYGTQFTGDELNEAHRIVDSPVNRNAVPVNSNGNHSVSSATVRANIVAPNSQHSPAAQEVPPEEQDTGTSVTEQQLSSIRKLYERLGKAEPQDITALSFVDARKVIRELTAEYKEAKQNSKAS